MCVSLPFWFFVKQELMCKLSWMVSFCSHLYSIKSKKVYLRSRLRQRTWEAVLCINNLVNRAYQTIRDWSALQDSLISSAEGARMGLSSSLLWWELGTNLPGQGPAEWFSFWRIASKQFSFRGYILRSINWSPVNKSAQQVSNKTSNEIICRDTMHWTSDGFAYMYQWIYSCRIVGQFTWNFPSRACLTMLNWSAITIYRNKLRPFRTSDDFSPLFQFHL